MARNPEELKALGHKAEYSQNYAPEVLETFENQHPDNDYWVRFNCPEFTTLCPITGQPDFAEIRISYVPDVKMVESKSLKLYLFSFRSHGDFHEDCVNTAAASPFIRTPITAVRVQNGRGSPGSASPRTSKIPYYSSMLLRKVEMSSAVMPMEIRYFSTQSLKGR